MYSRVLRQVNLLVCALSVANCVMLSTESNSYFRGLQYALLFATTACGVCSYYVAALHAISAVGTIYFCDYLTSSVVCAALFNLAACWILLKPHVKNAILQTIHNLLLLHAVKLAISLWNESYQRQDVNFDNHRQKFINKKSKFYWNPTQQFSFIRAFLRLEGKRYTVLILAKFVAEFVKSYRNLLLIQIFNTFATSSINNAAFTKFTLLWAMTYLADPASKYISRQITNITDGFQNVLYNYFIENYFSYKSDYSYSVYNISKVTKCCKDFCSGLSIWPYFLTDRLVECTSIYIILSKSDWLTVLALILANALFVSVYYAKTWLGKYTMNLPVTSPQQLGPESIVANMRTIKQYAWKSKLITLVSLMKKGDLPLMLNIAYGITDRVACYGGKALLTIIGICYTRELDYLSFYELSTLMHHLSLLMNCTNDWDTIIRIIEKLRRLEDYLRKGGDAYRSISYIQKQPIEASTANAVELNDSCFSWGPDKFSLQPMTLAIKPGSFVTVVGQVGSGKSSLLSALCGEMPLARGSGCVYGRLGYVSQKPWIMNATFRENVLFGNDYEEGFYNQVICACALEEDIKQLPAGDKTEIGHKGISLSGGQKTRLALARAIYNNADVYMLDDILSAVDAQVERHLVEQVLSKDGILNGKTCILVTHAEHVMPLSDMNINIVNGIITVDKLDSKKSNNLSGSTPKSVEILNSKADDAETAALFNICPELKSSQNSIALVWKFVSLSGYGVVAAVILIQVTMAYMQYYLLKKKLSLIPQSSGTMSANAICTYLLYELLYSVLILELERQGDMLQKNIWFTNAAKNMKVKLLNHLLDSKITMFERLSRHAINNAFGLGINSVSRSLASILTYRSYNTFKTIATLYGMLEISKLMVFAIAVPVLAVNTIRQLFERVYTKFEQKVDGRCWIDVHSIVDELVDGHEIIRVHNKSTYYLNYIGRLLSDIYLTDSQMISLRLLCMIAAEMVQMFITLCVILYSRYTATIMSVSPGNVQELATLSNRLYSSLDFFIETHGDVLETLSTFNDYLVYAENIDQEAPWMVPESCPANDWPSNGVIEFQDYSLRYRDELDVVLHNLSFSTKKHEKIGIVGRTGAGKSSLSFALLRLVEADSGSIFIDGVDISTLGLHDLRSRITMVPQDPMLLQGTIRMNLDPAQEYTDEELWKAIDKAHIRNLLNTDASKGETGLNTLVEEGGINFSVGQRQLISLCRSLLWKRTIVILDEATANIDTQTDQLMQSIIRKEFAECTVLTIAHRLKTVMDSDRIMVLDQGKIVEFDTPTSLLAANGQFSKLVQSMEFNESTLKQAE